MLVIELSSFLRQGGDKAMQSEPCSCPGQCPPLPQGQSSSRHARYIALHSGNGCRIDLHFTPNWGKGNKTKQNQKGL